MYIPHKLVVMKLMLFAVSIFISCGNNPQDNSSTASHRDNNVLILAPSDEQGERLIIKIIVADKQTSLPIPNAEVYLYQADTNGEYHPSDPANEFTAKLSGIVTSDESGKISVHTILPGEYEEPGNRHIHIHYARAEGYEQTGGVILFEDNVNDEVRRWANETGFGFIIDTKKLNGALVGNLELKLNPIDDSVNN